MFLFCISKWGHCKTQKTTKTRAPASICRGYMYVWMCTNKVNREGIPSPFSNLGCSAQTTDFHHYTTLLPDRDLVV